MSNTYAFAPNRNQIFSYHMVLEKSQNKIYTSHYIKIMVLWDPQLDLVILCVHKEVYILLGHQVI